jgi:SAM-dependent methyltransferase
LSSTAQSFRTKQAEVEFHNFASLGEPERAVEVYAEENERRGAVLAEHAALIGPFTPFLEIGANAGHTSYLLCNRFEADGFALDISADALRHGVALMDRWGLRRAPVRLGGDAARLPFRDNSLRLVLAYQMLSQFTGVDRVFAEVRRVLAPGGVFLFAEEPLRRMLSMRLYHSPYEHQMRPWERRLFRFGLLGYLAQDVIGSRQEEVFGIEQNHGLDTHAWRRLVRRYFPDARFLVYVPERGPGERWVKRLAVWAERGRSQWLAAELLGGSITGICRKEPSREAQGADFDPARFERVLQCPDCASPLHRAAAHDLCCTACSYSACDEGGVYNLLPSADRARLYPGDRDDNIDFSLPGHETKLRSGWYELDGPFGNRYRWIGREATALLRPVGQGSWELRVRGYAADVSFREHTAVRVSFRVNREEAGAVVLRQPGTFVFEAPLPAAPEYLVTVYVDRVVYVPGDDRPYGVNLSLLRLVSR